MEVRDDSTMARRLMLAACAAGFFWLFAVHVLTGFLDFMAKDGVGSRSGMVGNIDAAINYALVRPLGGPLAAAVLFIAGTGVAWLVGRAPRQDAGKDPRRHEAAPAVAPTHPTAPNNAGFGKRRVAPGRPAPASNASPERRAERPQVWVSSIFSNHEIGNKPGLRTKFFGEDWHPERHELDLLGDERISILRRYGEGHAASREQLPEAVAVFDEKCFQRMSEIFCVHGGFFVVRGNLAEALSRFDLGDGGLVPVPFYKADLMTPYGGEFSVLNFGARKNSILPDQSRNVVKFAVDHKTGIQHWKVNSWLEDKDVALSPAALDGPDLWFEEVVYNKIFVKGALAQALIEIGMGDVFSLKPCRIVEKRGMNSDAAHKINFALDVSKDEIAGLIGIADEKGLASVSDRLARHRDALTEIQARFSATSENLQELADQTETIASDIAEIEQLLEIRGDDQSFHCYLASSTLHGEAKIARGEINTSS